jgi:enoyl-CoA hydratase
MIPQLAYMTYHKEGHAGIVTLNRPASLNALNSDMLRELATLFESLNEDSQARAIVIRAEGKAFIAGADIRQMQTMTPDDAGEYSLLGNRTFNMI